MHPPPTSDTALLSPVPAPDTGPLPTFRFHDHGALVSIGRSRAVGSLVGLITGRSQPAVKLH
jgi:hypothetical protein